MLRREGKTQDHRFFIIEGWRTKCRIPVLDYRWWSTNKMSSCINCVQNIPDWFNRCSYHSYQIVISARTSCLMLWYWTQFSHDSGGNRLISWSLEFSFGFLEAGDSISYHIHCLFFRVVGWYTSWSTFLQLVFTCRRNRQFVLFIQKSILRLTF